MFGQLGLIYACSVLDTIMQHENLQRLGCQVIMFIGTDVRAVVVSESQP